MKSIDWEIIYRKIHGGLSASEEEDFRQWLNASSRHKEFYDKAIRYYKKREAADLSIERSVNPGVELMEKLDRRNKTIRLHKILQYAALIFIPLVIGSLFIFKPKTDISITKTSKKTDKKLNGDKVVLITSSGKAYELESGTELPIEEERGVKIQKYLKSGLKYEKQPTSNNKTPVYNTLKTAKSGDFQVELADGTIVYLNCNSELRYPVAFGAGDRKVQLKGEAYFDVRKNGQPFIVDVDKMAVEVMGTRFNVMAYGDESAIKTTLVSGKVKVKVKDGNSFTKELLLSPGQQASLAKSNGILDKKEVDTELYTSWINGYFRFEDQRMEDMMRTISRWYGVEVYYQEPDLKNRRLTGKLYRFENFSVITNLLEKISGVEIVKRNNTITIKEKG